MLTSIIMLTKNQLEYTQQCIESIREYTKPNTYEIIVVDNASEDGSAEWIQAQKDVRSIINHENLGFPKGCNQGIAVAKGENIVLLNNDVIVTENWLDNLLVCLESDAQIGAVGAITNNCSYYQSVATSYSSLAEMQQFAQKVNVSNPKMWEERLKLVGFCMLIHRSAIEQIGMLDERFSPGNYEDDDFSLRLRQAGYKLMLCKDSFIHHYGSVSFKQDANHYSQVLSVNKQKFKEKWSFAEESIKIDFALAGMLNLPASRPLSILEVGCGCGGTLLNLRSADHSILLNGVESNPVSRSIASQFASVFENLKDIPEGQKFDYILLSESPTYINAEVLQQCSGLLKDDGELLVTAHNMMHHRLVLESLKGVTNPARERAFTITQLEQLLLSAGYEVKAVDAVSDVRENEESLVQQLAAMVGQGYEALYQIAVFKVRAKLLAVVEPLVEAIEMMTSNPDQLMETLQILSHFSEDEVIQAVVEATAQPEEWLNIIALGNYQLGLQEQVLPYLQKAIELKPNHADTIMSMATVLHEWGLNDMALDYLKKLSAPTTEANNLMGQIRDSFMQQSEKLQQIRYLLRRIEFGINMEESLTTINQALIEGSVSSEDIEKVLQNDIADRQKVLEQLINGTVQS